MADEERCFPWKLSQARATTVGAKTLNIPSKAKSEFEKACDAAHKNKFEEAEQHAHSAIEKFEAYPAAWVMLALSLKEPSKAQDARDACSHAAAIDLAYLPAYLCTAELSVRNQGWKEAIDAADHALSLESGGDVYGYYYRATAYLHMNNLTEAKKSVVQGMQIDVNHDVPTLGLLMAEIYEFEGDNANAVAQLQQLLKRHPDPLLADAANELLARLASQQSPK